ncbi:hypothetical protein H5410_000627 [Solanum commersonii]|uniref:Uncharacterized protein n=1 Tax=Solanum commersonii TaxID=4109 RepID=A0A9J6AWK4_SOLCO|nr:hypothetical protein H5410_000627 [Solanum commersonii]
MLSSTFEMIFIASSNSHIIFCFCNFIIAILLVSGFQSSSQDNTTNILDHDMSKRKQAQGSPKATQFHKGMDGLDYQVRKMDTCATSQEMQTFLVSSDTSIIEVFRNVNQDNKSGVYDVDTRCQYHESANFNLSLPRETSFKCENIEEVSVDDTGDSKMDTHVTSKERYTFSVSSDVSTIKVLKEVNQDNKSEAYNDVAHFQHHKSDNDKQSIHQDTSFKCENVEEANVHVTIDKKMYLAKTRKETNDNNFEKSDEKEEDELRKRIEDFIEKINEVAILLVSGFQSSSQDDTTNILDHDISKRKQAQGNSKATQFHKGMNDTLTIEVFGDINQANKNGANANGRKMDTHVTSEEMHTFSVSSDISIIEVLKEVNQDNKNEAYNHAAHFQHLESGNGKQCLHQDTNFKCENVEGANANITIDTKMYLAKTSKETNDNNFEKSDEKEEDELRKRIEDFIEKINKGWRAEKLGIFYQSQ